MTTSITWWEKTVEYAFVLQTATFVDFAVPLAGVEERAGDGIFASDSKLLLIEFKRSLDAVSSEQKKFVNFEHAAEKLGDYDAHHLIVYGDEVGEENTGKPSLSLVARTYFSGKESEPLSAVFDAGSSKDNFDNYLRELLEFKRSDGRSSGTISPAAYASVVGISESRRVKAVSMSEYLQRELKYEYTMELSQAPAKRETPRMGGPF
ncbi:hypothetical protein PQQ72_12750 [Paraburkholderia strydomiana]|uniref:hypothetical protein n=1 Tax=Paraburkholderia strydomiana TaxID=1245417 RepID=UPI0038B7F6AA